MHCLCVSTSFSGLQKQKVSVSIAFLSDITSHLNVLNLQLQRWGHVISQMHCKTQFDENLCILRADFTLRFADFEAQKSRFFCSVIYLQQTWKAHHQTTKWRWLSFNTLKAKSEQSFHISSLTHCPAVLPDSSNSLYVHQHILVWTVIFDEDKLHTVSLLMNTLMQSWEFPQLRAWPQTLMNLYPSWNTEHLLQTITLNSILILMLIICIVQGQVKKHLNSDYCSAIVDSNHNWFECHVYEHVFNFFTLHPFCVIPVFLQFRKELFSLFRVLYCLILAF